MYAIRSYYGSFQPDNPDKQYAQGASLSYRTKHWKIGLDETSVGENYLAEAGYVRRTGYNFIGPELSYYFVPNKRVVSHGPEVKYDNYFDPDYKKIEHEFELGYGFEFSDRSQLSFGYGNYYVMLQDDFNPTSDEDHFLAKGTDYNYGGFQLEYQSTRKTIV